MFVNGIIALELTDSSAKLSMKCVCSYTRYVAIVLYLTACCIAYLYADLAFVFVRVT